MEQNTANTETDITWDDMLEVLETIALEPPSRPVEPPSQENQTAVQAIIADMLEGWYCRTMNEEAQRKSPLMTMIEATQPNPLMSLMNDEAPHMTPMISMMNEEQQQPSTSMLALLNEEPPTSTPQRNPMPTAVPEQPTMDVSSSVEDDTDEDESGTFDIDYKEMYTDLKKKMKILINENIYFKHSLRSHHKRLLKIIRDRSFLLDRLLKYQQPPASSSDSDETVESDDSIRVVEPQPKKRKVEPSTSQSNVSAMKPPAVPKRNKKTTKKQQQQQQQKQQQQHKQQQQQKLQQRQQQQQQQQQLPQPQLMPTQQQEQLGGPVLQMTSHLAVPHQQPDTQQLLQSDQLSQASQDMLDQLPPEDQLLLHMQQDKLMDLIKQIPQSQQLLQASQQQAQPQLMQPHSSQMQPTQQQLMQPMQQQQQQQQPQQQQQQQQQQQLHSHLQSQQQQMLPPQQQSPVVQSPVNLMNHPHMMQLQAMQPQAQHQPQVQQYMSNPTGQVLPPIRQQQQQIRQHQLDQMEMQQLQQHILFQPSTFAQQPATSSAYQFPLSMMSQVPTELLANTSYTELDVSPGDDSAMESQMTKEELERHLQSRQTMPQVIPEGELPIEMFSNNSSTEANDQL